MFAEYVLAWLTISVIFTPATTTEEWSHSPRKPRVYAPGGRPVQLGEFPYLVLLEVDCTKDGRSVCSGTIISRTSVLTSAVCDGSNITAYAGMVMKTEAELRSGNVQVRHVETVAKHNESDIMICYIQEPWVSSEFVKPVSLQLSKISLNPASVMSCQVIGFGQTEPGGSSGVAFVMDQQISSFSQCLDDQPPEPPPSPRSCISSFVALLCSTDVKDKTLCLGDEGGAAVCNGKQWGVNIAAKPRDNCIPPKKYNLYFNISYFSDWIRKNLAEPSSADSVHLFSEKIAMSKVLPYPPLWPLLLWTVGFLFLH